MSSKSNNTTRARKHEWIDAVLSPSGPPDLTRRAILLVFARWVPRNGDSAAVSAAKLGAQLHAHARTVQRHLALAAREGWLERAGFHDRYMTRRYRIRLPAVRCTAVPTAEDRTYGRGLHGGTAESSSTYGREPHYTEDTDIHARALERLSEIMRIEQLDAPTPADLESLNQIAQEGGHVNGVNLAQRAEKAREMATREAHEQC